MRTLLGWSIKLSIAGLAYAFVASGFTLKLPDSVMGFKVPVAAQQWVDQNAQIGDLGRQATDGFNKIGSAYK